MHYLSYLQLLQFIFKLTLLRPSYIKIHDPIKRSIDTHIACTFLFLQHKVSTSVDWPGVCLSWIQLLYLSNKLFRFSCFMQVVNDCFLILCAGQEVFKYIQAWQFHGQQWWDCSRRPGIRSCSSWWGSPFDPFCTPLLCYTNPNRQLH